MRPFIALQAALLFVMILSGASPVNGQARLVVDDNYARYSPGDMVERYKSDPKIMERTVTGEDDNGQSVDVAGEWQTYITGMTGVICLCVCGFMLFCGFCCWNACTCSTPMDHPSACTPPAACATKQAKMCQLGTAGLLGLLLLIFAILGFVYTGQDDTAVRNLTNVLGDIAGRFDYISGEVNHFESSYNSSSGNRTALFAAINGTTISNTTAKNSLDGDMSTINNANAEIDDVMLSGTGSIKDMFSDLADDLRRIKADADRGLDDFQDTRYDANIAIVFFIMVAGCCAVFAVAAPSIKESFREMTKAYCLSSCCVICMLLFTMLLAAVYLFITTLVADVCYDPKGWMVKAMDVPNDPSARTSEQNMSSYYIECGGYDADQRRSAWPLAGDMADMGTYCADMTTGTSSILKTLVDGNILASNRDNLVNNSAEADRAMCDDLIGEDGLVGWNGVVKCAVINELYEQVLFDICDDLFNPIALMYEIFVCLAVILIFAEIVQKFARRMEDKDGTNKYDPMGNGTLGAAETPNPTFDKPSANPDGI